MKNHLQEAHLAAYERRLEALGAMLDREIHTILLHLAHELPLSSANPAKSVAKGRSRRYPRFRTTSQVGGALMRGIY